MNICEPNLRFPSHLDKRTSVPNQSAVKQNLAGQIVLPDNSTEKLGHNLPESKKCLLLLNKNENYYLNSQK